MAVSVSIQWNGDAVKKGIDQLVQLSLLKGSQIVQADAVSNAPPPRTGNHRRSIVAATNLHPGTSSDDTTGGSRTIRPEKNIGLVGTIVVYAAKLEETQPYLGPALNTNKDRIIKLFKDEIKRSRCIK